MSTNPQGELQGDLQENRDQDKKKIVKTWMEWGGNTTLSILPICISVFILVISLIHLYFIIKLERKHDNYEKYYTQKVYAILNLVLSLIFITLNSINIYHVHFTPNDKTNIITRTFANIEYLIFQVIFGLCQFVPHLFQQIDI